MASPASGLWDDAVAARIIGATVLVGVTHPAHGGRPERHEQFFGVVVEAVRGRGVLLDLSGTRAGEQHWLPPTTSTFVPADPGVYRLRSTGEEVVDGRLRRYYTLTERGTASLTAYATRMVSVSTEALRRLSAIPRFA